MLRRLRELARERADFAFESTLSGRSAHRFLTAIRADGYDVHIFYLWLPTAEFAVARVHRRVTGLDAARWTNIQIVDIAPESVDLLAMTDDQPR